MFYDEFEEKYSKHNSPFRPLVLFYDEEEDYYYFLRVRGDNNSPVNSVDKHNENSICCNDKCGDYMCHQEIPLSQTKYKTLDKNSLVDCSQIFRMKKDLFDSLLFKDVKSGELKQNDTSGNNENTWFSPLSDVKKHLIKQLKHNVFDHTPPYFSLIEIGCEYNPEKKITRILYIYQMKS